VAADASIGEFQVEPRTRSDAGCGVHGEALLIAHQREPGVSTLRYDSAANNCPLWATRASRRCIAKVSARRARSAKALRAFAVARDGLALRRALENL